MERRDFLKAAGLFSLGGMIAGNTFLRKDLFSGKTINGRKPNIIFILADDLGLGEVSCYGSDNYRTPNIDKLAKGGTRFTHAYTPSLCGPSRTNILSGRYGFRTGGTNQDAVGRIEPENEVLTPTVLKSAGYATAAIGKWSQLPLEPNDFGFDYSLKFAGSGKYWNTQKKFKGYNVNGKTVALADNEYMPDIMHKHVVDFMTTHRNEPFYIHYAMSHIHSEILRTPDSHDGPKNYYTDNITYMDKLVGELVSEVDRLKLRENTVIIFFSDNGAAKGHAASATIGGKELSGCKGTMLEGGSVEPLIINWPGVTPAGKVCDELIDSTDFLPTFAEIAGVKVPQDRPIDGHSFNSRIKGENAKLRDWVFIQLGEKYYVRSKSFKLTESGELFDMKNAPFEEIPVPADTKNPEAIAARKSLKAALDQLNPTGGIIDGGDGTGRHAKKGEKGKVKDKKVKPGKEKKNKKVEVEEKDE